MIGYIVCEKIHSCFVEILRSAIGLAAGFIVDVKLLEDEEEEEEERTILEAQSFSVRFKRLKTSVNHSGNYLRFII